MSLNNNEVVSFYLKVAYTEQSGSFNISPNVCIANFIENAKYIAYENFNIDRNSIIEIVDVHQEIVGQRAEEGPALERDFSTTIRQRYNGNYTNLAFYVRIIQ